VVSVAELEFSLMLAVSRRVAAADRYVRSREGWDRDRFTGVELAGKTLGIVGFGHIGKLVAVRAHAFDMQVRCFDPFVEAPAMAEHGVGNAGYTKRLTTAASKVLTMVMGGDAPPPLTLPSASSSTN